MTTRSGAAPVLLLAVSLGLLGVSPARAGTVADRHAAWRGCLHRAFTLQAALTARPRAAEASLHACQDREAAYLSALSASPLVDGDDVARVRPALLQRARGWLLTGGTRPL
ncbi:MAG: hypothetical protein Q7T93_11490 [Methylobacterium sp.]|uniref:hypothetical protein n=1 Tax=unclassified Methylobacterium TaxID=2615210 RepID=UPI0011C9FF89|nr:MULTISPECIES: hypothetical protein [unclassified Methylobacterium]MDO9427442.1 hypothetical protein [Methylobacterium sp.]TXM65114.1 hypothetical protein FV218_21585 [Methylobacterium sp. WL69]